MREILFKPCDFKIEETIQCYGLDKDGTESKVMAAFYFLKNKSVVKFFYSHFESTVFYMNEIIFFTDEEKELFLETLKKKRVFYDKIEIDTNKLKEIRGFVGLEPYTEFGTVVYCLDENFFTKIKNCELTPLTNSKIENGTTTEKVAESIQVLKTAINSFKKDNMILCFNGGKDCTVVLSLFLQLVDKVNLICFYSADNFEEMQKFFIRNTMNPKVKNLYMVKINKNLQTGLIEFNKKHPNFTGYVMGCRRDDFANDKLNKLNKHIQECDEGWPRISQINPILNWTYTDVWDYLLKYKVPYCELYDQGYTSIGSKTNSKKNIYLRNEDSFQPAYTLKEKSHERSSRE